MCHDESLLMHFLFNVRTCTSIEIHPCVRRIPTRKYFCLIERIGLRLIFDKGVFVLHVKKQLSSKQNRFPELLVNKKGITDMALRSGHTEQRMLCFNDLNNFYYSLGVG